MNKSIIRNFATSLLCLASVELISSSANAACTAPPSGLVSWWRGEGNLADTTGLNNGVTNGTITFTTGKIGLATAFDGSSYVSFTSATNLNVGVTGTGVTIEGWIKPGGNGQGMPLLEWSGGGLQVWVESGFRLFANVVDTNGNAHVLITGVGVLSSNVFQHVALTYDKSLGTAALYINGSQVVVQNIGSVTPQTSTGANIGYRTFTGETFIGAIDELSIYNRGLSSNEISAIFLADNAGKCLAPSLPSVIAGPITNQANGHIYYLLSGGTWTESEAKAISLGGHLATINDAAENNWVTTTFSSYGGTNRSLWIGFNDVQTEGTFVWASGENAGYTNWRSGEPNGGNGPGDDYTYIYGEIPGYSLLGQWNDIADVNTPGGDEPPFFGVVEINTQPVISCLPPPAGIVSWWKGESDGGDSLGVNSGTVLGTSSYATGKVGQGFSMDGVNGVLQVPASSSLNVGVGGGLTFEAWIYPSNSSPMPIFEWSQYPNNGNYESGLWTGHPFYPTCNLYGFFFETNNTIHEIFSFGPLVTSTYEHVAMTYDKVSGLARLFINGAMVTEASVGSFTPKTTGNFNLGSRPPGDAYSRVFNGRIDESSLYNRALTSNEIAAIFNTSSVGKCPPPPIPPLITAQPTNYTTFTGGTAAFKVTAQGTGPLYYQWRQNGTNVLDGTNATLNLTNVRTSQAGNYSVVVSNAANSVVSSNASLTVIPVCTVPPTGLVSWWRGQGDLTDVLGRNDGVANGSITFASGMVGQASVFNGNSYISFASSSNLDIGVSGAGVTIEGWIKPTAGSASGVPIIEWVRPGTGGLQLWVEGGFRLFGNIVGTNGVSHSLITANGALSSNVFQHVALTYSKASGIAALYINGTQVITQNIGSVTPMTSAGVNIGYRTFTGATYAGLIDDLSVYNRGLSSNEISAIYVADSAGKCVPECVTPPTGLVSWWKGEGSTLDQIGTNNAILQGNLTFAPGLVGTAFRLNATNAALKIPASPRLNVGASNGFTIESWINLSNSAARSPIFEWNNGLGSMGVHMWVAPDNAGELFANVPSTGGATHTFRSAPGLIPSGVYQHVALTYNKTSGLAVLYLNGAIVAQSSVGAFTPLTSYDLYVGRRVSGAPGDVGGVIGIIDEPSVYSRTLSSNEIASIFLAGFLGKCNPNHPPVAAAPFSIGATIGLPTSVKIIGGKHPPTDADNDKLIITAVSGAAHGGTSTDGTNVIYTATGGATDSFVCTITDGKGGVAQQVVNVVISPAGGLGFNQLAPQSLGGGSNLLTFLGTPAFKYALERATNIVPPVAWLPLMTNQAATNGWLMFIDVTSNSPVFYRTRYVP